MVGGSIVGALWSGLDLWLIGSGSAGKRSEGVLDCFGLLCAMTSLVANKRHKTITDKYFKRYFIDGEEVK
jgi:hypothetical protein